MAETAPPSLRILHLEDDLRDATLVRTTLEGDGIACVITCVQTRDAFLAALESGEVDLVLSDIVLPAFDGFAAVAMVRARWPALPVILVSGTLGEELAIDALKGGATDYVLKERLSRLAPAVSRAMREVETGVDRSRLEEQFIEAQKMEVIGHLASGVAHDFNNVLAVILGYSEVIASELAADSPLLRFTEEIRHAAERAAGLTRQLLIFGRKQTVQPAVLDLNDVVKGLENMLRRLIDENVELTVVPGRHLGRVLADPGYVGQVIMNLVVNARDAMPNGGRITIAMDNVTLDDGDPRRNATAPSGACVRLSVSDTGVGMEDHVKAHLFEAFFTTKPKGKGTGLGLATCQTIVRQCGGHIGATSQLGEGSTFTIHLPRVEQPAAVASPPLDALPASRGTETLLLVEDEPSVRHLARAILEKQGYEVLSASNGQDGLNVAQSHTGAPIRLVVTDVVMPLMNGQVMVDWLKATYPDLKVLFTSGYLDDAIARHGVLDPGVAFLAKPYTPATLRHKVRDMLDDPKP